MGSLRSKVGLACVASLSLVLAACGGGGSGGGEDAASGGGQDGMTKLTFLMPAPSVMQFHPWQIAKELGYFTEEGVDVEIVAGDGSSSILQQIISGNADAGLPSPVPPCSPPVPAATW